MGLVCLPTFKPSKSTIDVGKYTQSVGIFMLLLSWLSILTFPVWFGSAGGLFLMCGKSHTIIKSHTTHSMIFYDFCWWFGNVCFIGSFCCRKDFNRKTSHESCIRWLCKKIQTQGMGYLENIKAFLRPSTNLAKTHHGESCRNPLKGKDSHAICVPTQCDAVGVPGECNMVRRRFSSRNGFLIQH